MRSVLRGCLVAALTWTAAAADEITASQTAKGHTVEVVKLGDDDYVVRVDGQKMFGSGSELPDLSIKGVWGNFVVIEEASGGTACPAIYRAIDLGSSPPTVSADMGNCSDIPKITVGGNSLSMAFPQQDGPDQVATFSAGKTAGMVAPGPSADDVAHAAQCADQDTRNYVIGFIDEVVSHGPAAAVGNMAKMVPGSEIRYELEAVSDFEAIPTPPVDYGYPANTPMKTNAMSGGLMYDESKIPGAIDPARFTLCRGMIKIGLYLKNYQMDAPEHVVETVPIRFVVQPVANAKDYNITTYGITQAAGSLFQHGILSAIFSGH